MDSLLSLDNISLSTVTLLLTFGFIYFCKIWQAYGYFAKKGIPTPPHSFFFGNFLQIRKNKNQSEVLHDWTKKYGKTYGYYKGHLPVLVTSDLSLIEEIFVKQFSSFSARKKEAIDLPDNSPQRNLFNSVKARWKRMRNIMNPTFSSAKLKELNPLLIKCTDRLIDRFEAQVDKEINVAELYKRFTLDAIWNCAFGIDINSQYDMDNQYFYKAEKVFQNSANFTIPMYLGVFLHEFRTFFAYAILAGLYITSFISDQFNHPFIWLRNQIMSAVYIREQNPNNKSRDYLQIILETRTETSGKTKINQEVESSVEFSQMHIEKTMTTKEINMNLVLFLLAGYETSSTTLSYITYVLAKYQDEQQKLLDEIEDIFNDDSIQADYENVQKLKYMDMFIREVLRMYPIGNSVINRRCVNETNINGIQFEKNLTIEVDVLSIHYNKEIWAPVDPNEFYPERFSPQNKRNPLAYMGFGIGPKNCIGMKFALFEIKLALVKILRKFKVDRSEGTPEKLEFIEGIVRSPKNGINVIFKRR